MGVSIFFCSLAACSASFSAANCLPSADVNTCASMLSFRHLLGVPSDWLFSHFSFCSSSSTILTCPVSCSRLASRWEIHAKRTGS
ncbi:hypothetical protein L208DRAFT_1475757 [Tricholoma matsutake]|nr:hypothetical protein L208DRAFT_1475757 [Tricholoma matsutake 945]